MVVAVSVSVIVVFAPELADEPPVGLSLVVAKPVEIAVELMEPIDDRRMEVEAEDVVGKL